MTAEKFLKLSLDWYPNQQNICELQQTHPDIDASSNNIIFLLYWLLPLGSSFINHHVYTYNDMTNLKIKQLIPYSRMITIQY